MTVLYKGEEGRRLTSSKPACATKQEFVSVNQGWGKS